MNDLAEKALHGLHVARGALWARPMLSFAAAGLVVGCVAVVAGGKVGAARATHPLTSWFGLENRHVRHTADWPAGTVLLAAIFTLVLLWIALALVVHRTAPARRRVWGVAAAWAAPFAVGPPLMDTTVYSYVAFGLVQRNGHNPYAGGVSQLGDVPIVNAVEPAARDTPSGSGPLSTLVQHFAVSAGAGNAIAAVVVLRVIGVLAAIGIARLAEELVPRHRSRAVALTLPNPLVLLYVVSAAHLDGLLVVFALGALVAVRQRRWLAAVALAALAGSVGGPGFVLVPIVVVMHWLGRRGQPGWQVLGRDLPVAAAIIAAAGFAATDGFGWARTMHKQFAAHTPYSITGAVVHLFDPVVRSASYDDLAAGARITALTALACTLGYLLISARYRPVDRTAGFALLALALLAPVLYPWYLLWGTLCLAPRAAGPRLVAVFALSAAGCALMPAGFGPTAGYAVTGGLLFAVAAATGAVLVRRERLLRERSQRMAAGGAEQAEAEPQLEISRTAGRTSAR
jgi:hypothetical protein